MPKYARIEGGIVRETGEFNSIEDRFHPSLVWVKCAKDITEGFLYDGVKFLPPIVVVPTYQELRRSAYPSFGEQFDTIFHNGIDAWKVEIQAVKTRYPKV